MNADIMLEREPFRDVLIKTINEYYKEVFCKDVIVSTERLDNTIPVYVFLKPFFVSYRPFPVGLKEFLQSEYNIRGSLVKFIIGKIGVFVALHFYWCFPHSLFFIDKDVKNDKFFISPCNRTIRFYYYEKDYVDVVVKSGYKSDFIEKQIEFRKNTDLPFVPKIIDSGNNWYRESIMHGHALARVRDEELFQTAFKQVEKALIDISRLNRRIIGAKDYSSQLIKESLSALNSIDLELEKDLEPVLSKIEITDMRVPLGISHGDLQSGNIWVNKDKSITIYDWETVSVRSIWFDLIVLYGNIHSGCFSIDIQQIIKNDKRIFLDDDEKEYDEIQKKTIAGLVALEELVFCLREASQLIPEFSKKRAIEIIKAFSNYCKTRLYE